MSMLHPAVQSYVRDRKRKRREALADFVGELIGTWLAMFLHGWMLMLAVGVARHEWLPELPTIGYWWAVVLVALLRGVFSRIPPSKKDGDR